MMTAAEYLALLHERLVDGYDVSKDRYLGSVHYPLYARSRVVAGKYFVLKSITYERIELNEHVVARTARNPITRAEVEAFVAELKALTRELVKPSSEHMSSAITGVIVAEQGFDAEAAKALQKCSYSKSYLFGWQGWCYLRLLGIDLLDDRVLANRRGKEVMAAYRPGKD